MFKQINERMVNFMNENAMRKHEKKFKKTSHLPLPILVNCYDLKISPCLIPPKSAMQLTFQFTGFDFICSISVVEYLWLATKQHNFNTLRSNICPLNCYSTAFCDNCTCIFLWYTRVGKLHVFSPDYVGGYIDYFKLREESPDLS